MQVWITTQVCRELAVFVIYYNITWVTVLVLKPLSYHLIHWRPLWKLKYCYFSFIRLKFTSSLCNANHTMAPPLIQEILSKSPTLGHLTDYSAVQISFAWLATNSKSFRRSHAVNEIALRWNNTEIKKPACHLTSSQPSKLVCRSASLDQPRDLEDSFTKLQSS